MFQSVIREGRQNDEIRKVAKPFKRKRFPFTYSEEDGCGSIDFEYRGVAYHVWEFFDDDIWGAETNVKNMGRHEDLFGEYEREIIDIVQTWN